MAAELMPVHKAAEVEQQEAARTMAEAEPLEAVEHTMAAAKQPEEAGRKLVAAEQPEVGEHTLAAAA